MGWPRYGLATAGSCLQGIVAGGAFVSAAPVAPVTHTHMHAKGLADKKLTIFNVNVNYKNIIYYILLVFIILTYSTKKFRHQLKLWVNCNCNAQLGLT